MDGSCARLSIWIEGAILTTSVAMRGRTPAGMISPNRDLRRPQRPFILRPVEEVGVNTEHIVAAIRNSNFSTRDLVLISCAVASCGTNTASVFGQYGEE